MIILIDNYDSFVYNLARYLHELNVDSEVIRNDQFSTKAILARRVEAILLSPGPSTPQKAGWMIELILAHRGIVPILGICLGHQAIAHAYGGRISKAPYPAHAISNVIYHHHHPLFDGFSNPFTAGRYHSLMVDRIPPSFRAIARTGDDINMAIAHDDDCIYGMQFHPESILTDEGHQFLANFLRLAGIRFTPMKNQPCMTKKRSYDLA